MVGDGTPIDLNVKIYNGVHSRIYVLVSSQVHSVRGRGGGLCIKEGTKYTIYIEDCNFIFSVATLLGPSAQSWYIGRVGVHFP